MILDVILRGGAIGTIFVTALVLVARIEGRARWAALALGLLVGCYVIVSAPDLPLAAPWAQVLIAGAALAPIAMIWFALELFTGEDQKRWPVYLLAFLAAGAALFAQHWPPAAIARGVLALGLYGGVVALAVRADGDDLMSRRRKLRRMILGLMGVTGIAISVVELTALDRDLQPWVYMLQSGGIWALALLFAHNALSVDTDVLPTEAPARPVATAQSQQVKGDLARLNAAIATGIWRREGLSIADLARAVNMPEHRLRGLINKELGWRNFSSFINHHRINDAKRQLADPDLARKTVLEVAFDCGFASLGPFNRSFRAETGQTPTQWRATHLDVPPD